VNRLSALALSDLKIVFRDKTLTTIFLVPFVIILFLRYAVPLAAQRFPVVAGYYPVILAFFCYLVSSFPAFLASFVMLDEKDEDVLTVIKVMPFSLSDFLAYRMLFIVLAGTFFSSLAILLSGLAEMGPAPALALSFLFALSAPLTTLTVVTFAKNKIEGLSVLKGLSAVLMLPLLSFFIASPWKFTLGVIPVFWTYTAFQEPAPSLNFALYYAAGLALNLLLLAVLRRQFARRV
jgi:fluoroquinolone transport system permease protein